MSHESLMPPFLTSCRADLAFSFCPQSDRHSSLHRCSPCKDQQLHWPLRRLRPTGFDSEVVFSWFFFGRARLLPGLPGHCSVKQTKWNVLISAEIPDVMRPKKRWGMDLRVPFLCTALCYGSKSPYLTISSCTNVWQQ